MNMFKEVADIKTSDQLHLPVPEAKFETVVVQPSEYQKDMVASLSERAADVHAGIVDPSVDNMLKITSDGRKLGLDQRLMNTLLPDDPDSKLNACVGNILRIWQDGQADKLTQLVFCDLSTPKNDGTFNVYDDVKTKLIANGVPAEEVAFIHDADTEAKKKDLFAKVRTGQVRVLLGSTQKMGAGTNVQDKLVAVHHLDVGWRPSDMTQRNGRIIRQGNRNKEVQVYQYVTEGTFDAYLYQTLENKQKFISQIMTSKSPVRSCDDVDEQALSYAEIKALCAGNPLIKEKMDLDIDVARLKVLKADHQSQQYRMEDKLLKYFPAEIEKQTGYIHGFEADIKTVEAHPQIADGFCGMEIMGKAYTEKADAGEILLAACKDTKSADPVPLGSYRGFQMELSFDSFRNEFDVTLKGAVSHRVALGTDARGNITRLDNALAGMQGKKVLLIDADPQGDLTTCLGWQDTDNLGITLATKLTDVINETMNDPTVGILHHDEGVDLIPANLELSAMEFNLVNAMSRETALRNYLSEVKEKYDYILIDCMPSLGMVTINALSAADSVIIPVQAQYLPAKGMTQLVQTISRVKKRINPGLKIDGMLLTLVDSRTNLAKSTVEALRENFGSQIKMYRTYIPIAVKAAETSSKGKSIFAYEPGSTVSKAYTEFTKEVLADGRKKERLHSHEAR